MNKKHLLALFLGASLLTVSCDTDEITSLLPGSTTPTTATPNYPANQGFFQLVNTVTTASIGTLEQEVRVYTATAFVTDGSSTSIDVGEVSVEDKKLTQQASNVYVYQDVGNPIEPTGTIDWKIAGSSAFDAASMSSTKRVPKRHSSGTKITSISLSGYNANVYAHDADSTLVMIADATGKNVIKTFKGSATTGNFSQEELSGLTATTAGFVQITPYNYVLKNINGKDIVVGTQSTYTYAGVELK